MDKVSVIIPTYNRFKYLLNTIRSVQSQTYPNIEIIVVNDASTQKEYYSHEWGSVKIIHLEKNSKSIYGYGCAGVRNQGIKMSEGKYVAICDDDDIWFPKKIELQLQAMKESGCKMSATEAILGKGVYDETKKYEKYNSEGVYNVLQKIYRDKGSSYLINGFPKIWTLDFLKIHNCMIASSVILEKEILQKINGFGIVSSGEDYDCWKRALEHTDSVYLSEPCIYYDCNHGDGQN